MSEVAANALPASSAPELAPAADGHLRRNLSTSAVVFIVLAYLAPLGGAAGYVALIVGSGNGIGAPMAFLAVGAGMLIFAVGYVALVRNIPNPGAFYAYITAALGKRIGLGSSFLSVVFYIIGGIAFYVYAGIAVSDLIETTLHGPQIPWWPGTFVLLAVTAVLAYRGIELNAKVMGTILLVEVVLIVAFIGATVLRGGPTGRSLAPFNPVNMNHGPSLSVAFVFVLVLFLGFESAAIYSEEARDGQKTVARATYVTVAVIAVFYAVTAWAFVTTYGVDQVTSIAAQAPATAFLSAMSTMLGGPVGTLVSVLVITSILASELSIANVTSRYVYSLSVDRVLPARLSLAHHRFRSPSQASLTVSVAFAVLLLLVAITRLDAVALYSAIAGATVLAFEVLLGLVSISVLVYFARHREIRESRVKTVVAPLISLCAIVPMLYFTAKNITQLVGENVGFTAVLIGVSATAFIAGAGYATWLAKRRPGVYRRIGRQSL